MPTKFDPRVLSTLQRDHSLERREIHMCRGKSTKLMMSDRKRDSFSSTSLRTFALFAEASATNDDEKPPTNETRPSDKVTEVGLRRRVEENVFT